MTAGERTSALRHGDGAERVTNIELFFDLVFVFAVTQLSHSLLEHLGVEGAIETAILLTMMWQIWVYTTWATTFVDPRRISVRTMLIVLMLGSLVMSAALPEAFHDRGLAVGITYAVLQIGRSAFLVVVLRGEASLRANFARILVWCMASGALAVVGGVVHGHVREALWALAVAVEFLGAGIGFTVPGLGRSVTTDWTILGGHFAERCQAFVLIALGESIVVTGGTLSAFDDPSTAEIVAFVMTFAGSVGFWWVYFDRTAEDSARRIQESDDPGRLARSAFHWVHPVMVAGVVVSAAADERILDHPTGHGDMTTAWLALGSTALFLAGHAVFKALVWRLVPWPRVIAAAVLIALLPIGPHLSPLVLGFCALAALIAVGLCDRLTPHLE